MKFYWLWSILCMVISISDCDSSSRPIGLSRRVASNYFSCSPTETCTDIRQCPTFIELLRTQGHNLQTVEKLRKKNCGYGRAPIKICCPTSSTSYDSNQIDLSECGQSTRVDSLVVGHNTSLGDWPWAVAVGSNSSEQPSAYFHCAGALISNNWVLSAAHCFDSIGKNFNKFVRLGVSNLNEPISKDTPMDISIDRIITHPQYSRSPKIVNNIALVHLRDAVQYSKNVRRICLPKNTKSRKNEYYFKRFPTILGWNIANGKNNTRKLYETRDSLVENKKCAEKYTVNGTTLINDLALCTENLKKYHCQTDPGSLLILPNTEDFRQYLEGIASHGFDCSPENPKVYTRVAQFVDWIQKTLQGNN